MTSPNPPPNQEDAKESNATYLRTLLNKNLRVTTTDTRMFWGAFKCTDSVRLLPSLSQHPSIPFPVFPLSPSPPPSQYSHPTHPSTPIQPNLTKKP